MSMKRVLLFASMALAAMAFAIPAVASAARIYDSKNNTTLTTAKTIKASGQARFQALGSGVECTVDTAITTNGNGTTANVTKFEITTSTCAGFGFPYAG